jgi:hypothetical protein
VFPRADEEAAIRSHAQEPVPPLRPRVRGWLPDELEDIVRSCLEKEAANRPADMRALYKLLRAIEVPAEHAWTDERAQGWWWANRPKPTKPSTAPGGGRMILPLRSDAHDVSSPDAATVSERR